jgi:hypothetical protein
LIAALKVNKFRVLVTASTGIASESELAVILRALDVLIIDEISSVHKNIMFYVDRLLRSIDRDRADLEFAGKVNILLSP